MNITQFTNSFDACVGHAGREQIAQENYKGYSIKVYLGFSGAPYASIDGKGVSGKVVSGVTGDSAQKVVSLARKEIDAL